MKMKISEMVYAAIGLIEVLIGIGTLSFLAFIMIFTPGWAPDKAAGVSIFVAATAFISLILGAGLLKHKEWARVMLIFFSGYIMILKGSVFAGIVNFNGEMVSGATLIVKDAISFIYHLFVFIALCVHKKRTVEI